ncbi:unnamed protein product, partial [Didymodactylos carnosus]
NKMPLLFLSLVLFVFGSTWSTPWLDTTAYSEVELTTQTRSEQPQLENDRPQILIYPYWRKMDDLLKSHQQILQSIHIKLKNKTQEKKMKITA